MSDTEKLLTVLRRKFPDNTRLRDLSPSGSYRDDWKLIAAALQTDLAQLARILAAQFGISAAPLPLAPTAFAVQLVPEKIASGYGILPLREEAGSLVVALSSPFNNEGLERVQFISNRKLIVQLAPPRSTGHRA